MVIGAVAWIAVVVGCVLGGPGKPGCSEDGDCAAGFVCRAGACFHESSGGAFVPADAGDAGDAGDAADDGDAAGEGDGASDAPSDSAADAAQD
jgi:Cys-rich repeat protein